MAASRQVEQMWYRIGEVANLVKVEPHVLRYWEREFRSVRPTKSSKGQRVYSRRDVERLLRIRELLYEHKYTIAGAKRRLRTEGVEPVDHSDPANAAARSLRQSLLGIRDEISEMLDEVERW